MLFRVLLIGFFILELFGCSAIPIKRNYTISERCYESSYMVQNEECLDSEIIELEEDLSDSDRAIYEMAKRKISDRYQQLYFLRLSPKERRSYLSYIYNGEPPVYQRNGIF